MMHWSASFIGIPYADLGRDRQGCDCWGLARLVLREAAGVDVPGYDGLYATSDERAEIAAIVAREAASPIWRRVDGKEREFDIAFFRRGRLDAHAGIVVAPGGMLHMAEEDSAKIERYDRGPWLHRLTGIYRFHLLEARP